MTTSRQPSLGPDPELAVAFALHRNPGAHALLLGAGVSTPSGILSAWGIQQDLIKQIMHIKSVPAADPLSWFEQTYGTPSTYDDLLAQLAPTKGDRQALLRTYFEPKEDDVENGLKIPTVAHHAIARLVASGRLRIILTTNFDRLVETALREAGIEPTVVAQPSDITGLAPLHAISCLVVHLHGDYLTTAGMLNTSLELNTYVEAVDGLLDHVLPNYGLLIAGWSGRWDPALRQAIDRNPTRHYGTYWIDSNELVTPGRELLQRRDAIYLQEDADHFFARLADATDALADTDVRDPLTVTIAVATAKRELSGRHTAIPLHDDIQTEFARLHETESIREINVNAADPQGEHKLRLSAIEAALQVPMALVATAAYWGNEQSDEYWIGEISLLAVRPRLSGVTSLINLSRFPACALQYTGCLAAIAAGRFDLFKRLIDEPVTENDRGDVVPVIAELTPQRTLNLVSRQSQSTFADSNHHLFQLIRPLAVDALGLAYERFREAWEMLEYLKWVEITYSILQKSADMTPLTDLAGQIQAIEQRLAEGKSDYPDQARDQIAKLREAQRNQRQKAAAAVPRDDIYVRYVSREFGYETPVARPLQYQVQRQGNEAVLMRAGICGGSAASFLETANIIDARLNEHGESLAYNALPPGGGAVPMGPFWPNDPQAVER
ncbi:MAG: SIR2 family protein [Actinomycetota bacterium]|nr:SIR2 family protein [Actinomycetota bacterium]